ncbi:hypothetical protein HRR83_004735 [Exophiala dermatitidis]|uniref:Uncharacterized protein n=1 Tax=Exophiala dermatitidis TaxID=5970 RepID=A0AAN6F2B6_EXODE|nr:hypothetical protein HRR74_003984 [Exophiala dermatitidis]KAJ4529059.1 hypothetical protein HRR73_000079 [Exophiala dermatitidis]KAJ4538457.1 hypothetical protein HRR77_006941 [Exophiala dermatitidis]KAJ4544296.1 hypothetical protein HRR76_002362 [Exophiala dermatitidis]KAJ4561715.1 hypothetical protein HRR79_007052 [Exophiala dermatitidis]
MFQPKCVARSSTLSNVEQLDEAPGRQPIASEAFFRSVQWSADGTSLLASPSDHSIKTYIVPPDLLEEAANPHTLAPYCTIRSRDPVNAVVGYPFFNLGDPATTLVLSSMRDHPIRLHSALTGQLGASYPVVNPMTEAFISPHSLVFSPQGDRFIAGSESLISVFDVSRPGQEPVSSIPTGPKNRNATSYDAVMSMRGIVSALAVDATTGVLAAGTYSRHIGLYDAMGQGECIGIFSVRGTDADSHIGGGGITQVVWSPCGRYLHIAERKSDGVIIYDIRKTGQLLAWVEGRKAQTNQRLGVDLASPDASGTIEVWAGGLDGAVRMWKDAQQSEGAVAPTFEFKAHDDAVSGTVVHPSGGVIATSSGQRHFDFDSDENKVAAQVHDNSLKIWEL